MLRLPLALAGLVVLISGCGESAAPLMPAASAASVIADEGSPADKPAEKSTAKTGRSKSKEKSVEDKADTAPSQYNKLNEFESWVILKKGTERAFTGEYTDLKDPGTYICRRCNAPLYHAKDKFPSHCGWPSFDDEIEGAVKQSRDADGYRVEITCRNCGGHLGHVFFGEQFTEKNTRHCVNSVSMKFIPEGAELPPVVRRKSSRTSSRSSKSDKGDSEADADESKADGKADGKAPAEKKPAESSGE
ncbi:MAG: Peptide methionine sulfoxide reductase MsrB [Planctomycetota bacterium]|jgi:peptide-methionine (R)-S-oxide reductase